MQDNPLFEYERELSVKGYRVIAGVDEAGRGPLAGPVVAAAVILAPDFYCQELNDSKTLSASQREAIFSRLVEDRRVNHGTGIADSDRIDKLNILGATFEAMREALAQLAQTPELILVDGSMRIPGLHVDQRAIIKGDSLSATIAAASIIAKVTRDRLMHDYHRQFPEYGFDSHKGYATRQHMEMLEEHGPCPIHRRSFAPCRGQEKELELW